MSGARSGWRIAASAVAVGALLTTAQPVVAAKPFHSLQLGSVVPNHPLRPLRGGVSDVRGHAGLTLINLWATNCAPCRRELPELQRLHSDWHGRGFRVVSVSAERDRDALMSQILTDKAPDIAASVDERGGLSMVLGSAGLPESFVIDGHGRILWHHIGALNAGDPRLLGILRVSLPSS